MTVAEKNYIIRYRQMGKSCTEIARALGLSVNTVKSFCQRSGIAPIGQATRTSPAETLCLCCGEKNKVSTSSQTETFLLRCMSIALVAYPSGHGKKRCRPSLPVLRACVQIFTGAEILQPRLLYRSEIWRKYAWVQC